MVGSRDCKCLLFANNTKFFSSVNSLCDAMALQNNLNRLSEWSLVNGLYLNVSKCKIMIFSRKKTPFTYGYRLKNETLGRPDVITVLGVTFDPNYPLLYIYQRWTRKQIKYWVLSYEHLSISIRFVQWTPFSIFFAVPWRFWFVFSYQFNDLYSVFVRNGIIALMSPFSLS